MKKTIYLSLTVVLFSAVVNAQSNVASLKKGEKSLKQEEKVIKSERKAERQALRKLKGNNVSDQAKQAFIRDFGNLPGTKWERTENFDEASFVKKGITMTAFYDADASLVGTVQSKKFQDLPAKAQKVINEKYKDYTKGAVILFDDNESNTSDMVLYNQQFDDADNYFIQLKKDNKEMVLKVSMSGDVSFFTQVK
ncbi:MAG: hypothetical protein NTW29_12470 [Bacteroidetes bacterium]|nr:hypothetical protein [Bacteroidota bacterium]